MKISTPNYNEKSTFSGVRGSGNRSKIDLKTVLKITSIFGWNFDGFWTDFGGFSAPKIDQNRYQFRNRFLEGSKVVLHGLAGDSLTARTPA